jgi:LysM repeat protein
MLEPAQNQDELASLQNEFTGSGPQESSVKEIEPAVKPVITEAPMPEKVVTKKPVPMKVREEAPVIDTEMAEAKVTNAGTGNIKTYSVKKGETLMQIAFKIYGDISKWKELKKLNGDKLASNASLRSKLTLKYIEPETEFVWNPEGTPYMIQNGDTLGIISNNVYQTPKKWKSIWENNKPLIKNPNVIYAGFTLYYKNNGMANYVQPKTLQPKITNNKTEEIKVEQALTELERLNSSSEEITDIRSAVVRAPASEDAEESIPDTGSTTQTSTEDTQDDTPIDVAE